MCDINLTLEDEIFASGLAAGHVCLQQQRQLCFSLVQLKNVKMRKVLLLLFFSLVVLKRISQMSPATLVVFSAIALIY